MPSTPERIEPPPRGSTGPDDTGLAPPSGDGDERAPLSPTEPLGPAPLPWWRSAPRVAAASSVIIAMTLMNLVVEPRIAGWSQPTRFIAFWGIGLSLVLLVSFVIQRILRRRGWAD